MTSFGFHNTIASVINYRSVLLPRYNSSALYCNIISRDSFTLGSNQITKFTLNKAENCLIHDESRLNGRTLFCSMINSIGFRLVN